MRSFPTRALALSCATLLMGCRKAPTGTDASAERGPYTLAFVARAASESRFAAIDDDPPILDTGFFVYEVASDGILRRLGNAADYAPLVGELPDDVFGWEAQSNFREMRSQRIEGKVVLTTYGRHGRPPTSFQWDGRAWKPMSQPVREELGTGPLPAVLADAGITAPEGGWESVHRLRDGRYAWLRRTTDGPFTKDIEIYVARPHGGPGKVSNPVKTNPKTGGPVKSPRCAFLPSMDTRLYVECTMDPGKERFWSDYVLRLDGDDTWVYIDIPERIRPGAVAFDADGLLWFGFGSKGLGIGRRTTDGTTTRFEIPKPDPAIEMTFYDLNSRETEATLEELGDGAQRSYRQWTAGTVAAETGCHGPVVRWIVPRPSGDVWIGLRCRYGDMILRASRSEYKAAPIVIGTMLDGFNELRNTKPPRPWVGHCNQLFVMLAKASGDAGALNVDRIVAERAAIWELTKRFGVGFDDGIGQSGIVSGRLHDRNVAGVLLTRARPEGDEAAMEKAARDLVERFAKNPASPPEVFCTLPVLEAEH